jgi:hypothetical protein
MKKEDNFTKLDLNTTEFISTLEQCSEGDLSLKSEGKWNVIQNLEHVLITENLVISLLRRPANKMADVEQLVGSDKLQRFLIDMRGRKIQAPDSLQPKGELKDVATFMKKLSEGREDLKKEISEGIVVIDNSVYKHPFLGEMTKRDWFEFIPLHAQRHLLQVKDLLDAR